MANIVLFDPNAKGKKSDNAPCTVTIPEVNFDSLPAETKAELIARYVRNEAVAKYNRLSKGYQASTSLLKDAKAIIQSLGIDSPDEDKLRGAATLLGKSKGIEVSFEPVTAFELTESDLFTPEAEETEVAE